MLTLSAVPPELYVLPWEVIQVGASGKYLSDHASAQVHYTVPGREPRQVQPAPPAPGILYLLAKTPARVSSAVEFEFTLRAD